MIDALKNRIKSAFTKGNLNVEEGERLPVFRMETQDGETVRSEEIQDAVLYFYPKAGTKGCTNQACSFRDDMTEFEDLDVEVYGVSTDSKEKLREFKDRQDLNFDLLSDESREVSEKMGVLTKAGFSERVTFLLKDGIIREIVRDEDPERHSEIARKFFSS